MNFSEPSKPRGLTFCVYLIFHSGHLGSGPLHPSRGAGGHCPLSLHPSRGDAACVHCSLCPAPPAGRWTRRPDTVLRARSAVPVLIIAHRRRGGPFISAAPSGHARAPPKSGISPGNSPISECEPGAAETKQNRTHRGEISLGWRWALGERASGYRAAHRHTVAAQRKHSSPRPR